MTTPALPESQTTDDVSEVDTVQELAKQQKCFLPPGGEWISLDLAVDADKETRSEVEKSREKLQNVLLVSLQTEHMVVLAGSGCSRQAGGPSMAELWNLAVEDPKVNKRALAVANTVNHSLDDKNIEALLSKVEAYRQVGVDEQVDALLEACKQLILDKCSALKLGTNLAAHKMFLHRLSRRRVRDSRLQVYTTNYDLCFERAAEEIGCVVLDGFSFTRPRRYDPRYFGYDIVRRRRGTDETAQFLEGVFLLYKLHGSVNWARVRDDEIEEKEKPDPTEACLIYPAAGKYQQSYTRPYLESVAQYLAAVREPNTCVLVTGFGFNDDHLSKPLLAAVESNPHLRLIVADPCAKENEASENPHWKRLYALNRQGVDVWFINADFPQLAELIPDLKSLTPAESLAKTLQGVMKQS